MLGPYRHRFHEGPIGKKTFFDILNYFIEIYKLQGLKLISFVITLIGQGQNEY